MILDHDQTDNKLPIVLPKQIKHIVQICFVFADVTDITLTSIDDCYLRKAVMVTGEECRLVSTLFDIAVSEKIAEYLL